MKAELIDSMGTDLTVVNAARVSFLKTKKALDQSDERLILYLAKHKHWTPFAHCQASFRCSAPIFVARQLQKHQVGLVWNEVSRRYVDYMPGFYVPDKFRSRPENKKQGSGDAFTEYENNTCLRIYESAVREAEQNYEWLLSEGVAPEQARAVLPLATYTEWVWTGSLAAWARVAALRLTEDAQMETGLLIVQIAKACGELWPLSWAALADHPK